MIGDFSISLPFVYKHLLELWNLISFQCVLPPWLIPILYCLSQIGYFKTIFTCYFSISYNIGKTNDLFTCLFM